MKAVASIVLLILLLYNMLGLSVAVLYFENDYQTAESASKSNEIRVLKTYAPTLAGPHDHDAGLYRLDDQLYNIIDQARANDTLYVTLQVNASAWQRFTELSEMMQEVNSDQKPLHPGSRAIRLLRDFVKVYLPVNATLPDLSSDFEAFNTKVCFNEIHQNWLFTPVQHHSPPPEIA